MKPVVSVAAQQWAIAVLGLILVGVSQLEHFTTKGVLGVVGAVLLGTLKVGLNQVSLSDLPKDLADFLRGYSMQPPPVLDAPDKPETDPLKEGPSEGP